MTTLELETAPQAAPPHSAARPLRLALIGCGAIAQQMHLPVLAGHEQIQLVALVDRDRQRAAKLAQGYGVPQTYADLAEIPPASIDAAIIATPPAHHAPAAITLLKQGVHVLVEKPMATRLAEAQAMCDAADQAGVTLAVGFFRRFFPSIRLLKGLLEAETFGRPVAFMAEGGGMYSWAAATLSHMRRDLAGGGVLIDYGSHVLDLLLFLFNGPAELIDYADNSLGGVEADCRLELRLRHRQQPVAGTVELARTRQLGNFIQVQCERATLTFFFTDRFQIEVLPHDRQLRDAAVAGQVAAGPEAIHSPAEKPGNVRPYRLSAHWEGEVNEELSWYDTFRLQIDDWLAAIRQGRRPLCDGRSALATVALIDQCYARSGRLNEPWVWEGVSQRGEACKSVPPATAPPRKRVLVTGATGFIGSRVAEVLHLSGEYEVRALVHNPGNAARLARLPVELVQGDLKEPGGVAELVAGCDSVVHCAIGTEWGQRRQIFAVTVGGTRRLVEAARRAGVRRLVHLSTMSVYGDDLALRGLIDESLPPAPIRGSEYGESKLAAERVVAEAARKGLEAVMLRPARVYGPFSRIFIQRPIPAMARGTLRWLGDPDVPADMVYVDNVVAAIVAALNAPTEAARGEVYNVGEESPITWREFYGYFAERFGLKLPSESVDRSAARKDRTTAWYNPLAWLRAVRQVVTSPEFKGLGRRVLATPPLGSLPRWAFETFPACERLARRVVGADSSLPVYRRQAAAASEWVEMGSGGALISIGKARRMLGYDPPVSLERGLELTAQWVDYARLVR
jgi:predicted dehydrogenase/nucleoside-diphosphate-sugar epimerase